MSMVGVTVRVQGQDQNQGTMPFNIRGTDRIGVVTEYAG